LGWRPEVDPRISIAQGVRAIPVEARRRSYLHPPAHSPLRPALEHRPRSEEAVIDSIRIVLADLPQLAADMLERAVAGQSDMLIVARMQSSSALLEVTRMTAPNVVILGLTEPDLPAQSLDLLAENVDLTVLGVQKELGVAHLYQLRPCHLELGEAAPEDLVREIRAAAQGAPFAKWRAIPPSQP
jgi:hypothetical protein